MSIILTQTDNSLTFEQGCAPVNDGAAVAARELVEGGTAGVNTVSVDPDNNQTASVFSFRTSGGLGTTNWLAGTHVVPVNISGANGDSIIDTISICERLPNGTYQTVQQFTGLGRDVSAAGVQTFNLTQSSNYTPSGEDSDLAYIFIFQNFDNHGNSTTSILPDQDIETPYTPPAEPVEIDVPVADTSCDSLTPSWIGVIPDGEVSFEESVTGGEDGGGEDLQVASVSTDEEIKAGNNNLYLCQINTQPFRPASGVSGGGLTWVLVDSKQGDRGVVGSELWKAYGSPSASFNVTATLGSNAHTGVITVSRYSGAKEELIDISTAGTGGTDDSNPTITTTSELVGSKHYITLNPRNRTVTTPDPDYTERAFVDAGSGGRNVGAYVYDNLTQDPGSDTFDVTLNSDADWSIVAAVIEPTPIGATIDIPIAETFVEAHSPSIASPASIDVPVADTNTRTHDPTLLVGIETVPWTWDSTAWTWNSEEFEWAEGDFAIVDAPVGDSNSEASAPAVASGASLFLPLVLTAVQAFSPAVVSGASIEPPVNEITVESFAPNIEAEPPLNEPDGFTLLTDWPMDAFEGDGWALFTSTDGEDEPIGEQTIESDPNSPISPPDVGQIRYVNYEGGQNPGRMHRSIPTGFTELYITYWFRISENWEGHSSGVNKIGFISIHGDPVAVPVVEGTDPDRTDATTLRPIIRLQNVPEGTGRWEQNQSGFSSGSPFFIEPGKYHRFEILLRSNTPGAADGEMHWWVDGTKLGEYDNVQYSGVGQGEEWDALNWEPTWGGVGDNPPETMNMRMAHIYASASSVDHVEISVPVSDSNVASLSPDILTGALVESVVADTIHQTENPEIRSGASVTVSIADTNQDAIAPEILIVGDEIALSNELEVTTLAEDTVVDVPVSDIFVEALAPNVLTGALVEGVVANILHQAQGPQIQTGVSLTPPVADTSVDSLEPQIQTGVSLTPPVVDTHSEALAPQVSTGDAVVVPAADTTTEALNPSVVTGVSVDVGSSDTNVETIEPQISTGSSINIPSSDIDVASLAPELQTGSTVHSPIAEINADALAPELQTGVSIDVPGADTVVVVLDPFVGLDIVVSPNSADTESVALAPNVLSGVAIDVPVADSNVEALPPEIFSFVITEVNVPVADSNVDALEPTVRTGASVDVVSSETTLDALSPNLIAGAGVAIPVADTTNLALSPGVSSGVSTNVPIATTVVDSLGPEIVSAVHTEISVPVASINVDTLAPEIITGVTISTPSSDTILEGVVPHVSAGPLFFGAVIGQVSIRPNTTGSINSTPIVRGSINITPIVRGSINIKPRK